MKLSIFAAVAAAATAVDAHYIFNILFVNGKQHGGEYTYVRRNSNSYNPAFPDIVDNQDLRCNVGARPGGNVGTFEVNAGDRIALKVFNNEVIEHPGPGFVYMSRAPGSVSTYDGSGDWFKVWESGLCRGQANTDGNWCTWAKDRMEFTIPAKTPPGEYLVRFEHIGLHEGHVSRAQFYIQCLQLRINGPGGGNPSPLAKIPGIYKQADPGIRYNKWTNNPAPYVMPGPRVWNGQ
ncbi:family 61 putative glycoside hydrolase [Naviculisporaceae sp. PSN 640]